jgi:hypothetical protein
MFKITGDSPVGLRKGCVRVGRKNLATLSPQSTGPRLDQDKFQAGHAISNPTTTPPGVDASTATRLSQRGLAVKHATLVWKAVAVAVLALPAVHFAVQSSLVLIANYHPAQSTGVGVWIALTTAVTFALATAKAATGKTLATRCCAPVTMIDGILAVAVLAGLDRNAGLRRCWG